MYLKWQPIIVAVPLFFHHVTRSELAQLFLPKKKTFGVCVCIFFSSIFYGNIVPLFFWHQKCTQNAQIHRDTSTCCTELKQAIRPSVRPPDRRTESILSKWVCEHFSWVFEHFYMIITIFSYIITTMGCLKNPTQLQYYYVVLNGSIHTYIISARSCEWIEWVRNKLHKNGSLAIMSTKMRMRRNEWGTRGIGDWKTKLIMIVILCQPSGHKNHPKARSMFILWILYTLS